MSSRSEPDPIVGGTTGDALPLAPSPLEVRAWRVLEGINDPCCLLDRQWRFVLANPRALEFLARTTEQLRGLDLREVFPSLASDPAEQRLRTAVLDGTTVQLDVGPQPHGRVAARIHPSPEGFLLFIEFSETPPGLYATLDEAVRGQSDPEQVAQTMVRTLGRHLGVSRCVFARIAADGARAVSGEFCDGVASIVGRPLPAPFGDEHARALRAGATFVVDDVENDARVAPPASALGEAGVAALVSVPILKEGVLAGELAVHQAAPRAWSPREVGLVEAVASRCWESVERARLGRLLARTAAALRDSEERLLHAASLAQVGTFESELGTGIVRMNEPGLAIYGWPSGTVTTFAELQSRFHQEDRERVLAEVHEKLTLRGTGELDLEHRIVRLDGATRWVRVRARVMSEAAGSGLSPGRVIGTYVDITDRKEAEERGRRILQAEREAREEAERVARMKDEFLATLSHELRTPLHAILGWAQLLRRKDMPPGEIHGAIETIDRNARAQAQLIDDLLDMSRIVSGRIRIEMQHVDLPALVRAAVESVRPSAAGKDIDIRLELAVAAAFVTGDPSRLQQVVGNLLGNAVKFTPRGGRIEVALAPGASGLELAVRDSGVGIDPEFLPHVFEAFRQGDASTTRRHGGIGLGLSIAKQLVLLHGGTVRVESGGPGKGATFVVSIPDAAPEPAVTDRRRRATPRVPFTLSFAPGSAPLQGLKVLVLDDEPDARDLLRGVLHHAGAAVVTVDTSHDALAVLGDTSVDVIVSDLGMPSMDGYEFIREVRGSSNRAVAGVRAIAVSAYARPEDRDQAFVAGFQRFLAKPVDAQQLIEAVVELARPSVERRRSTGVPPG